MKKISGQLLRWLNVGLVLTLLVCYAAPYTNPNTFWPFSFVGMAFPFLFVACLLMLIYWIFQRKKVFLFNLIALLAGIPQLSNTFSLNLGSSSTHDEGLTVLTYNTLNMRHTEYRANEMDKKIGLATNYVDLMAKQSPDIVCLQEAYLPKELQTEVERQFEHKMGMPYVYREYNQTIFSKYPIVNKGVADINKRERGCIYADIKIDTTIIRVYNVHLQSNRITVDTKKILEEATDLNSGQTRKTVRNILSRVKYNGQLRATESELVHAHISGSPHQVIVCGDFNETPYTYPYHQISKGLKDTFHKQSFGMQVTYNGAIPLLRIDYILADKRFKVLHQYKVDKTFSDHHPVVAKLIF